MTVAKGSSCSPCEKSLSCTEINFVVNFVVCDCDKRRARPVVAFFFEFTLLYVRSQIVRGPGSVGSDGLSPHASLVCAIMISTGKRKSRRKGENGGSYET